MLVAMRAGDRQRHLPGMPCLSSDRLQQQWTAGDRLRSMIEICQTHEQAPPVVNQRNTAREQATTLQIARGKAAPAPLVLKFVKRVFTVRPIAIYLTQGEDLAVQRRDQCC